MTLTFFTRKLRWVQLPGPAPIAPKPPLSIHSPSHLPISYLAMLSRPARPSLIRDKLADATVSHSGDSCAQGRCDVPPGPLWPHWRGELSLTLCAQTRLPSRAPLGQRLGGALVQPRGPSGGRLAAPDGRTVAHQKSCLSELQPRRIPLL